MVAKKITKKAKKTKKKEEVETVSDFDPFEELYATNAERLTLLYCDARVKNAELAKRNREQELLLLKNDYQLLILAKILDEPDLLMKRATVIHTEEKTKKLREELDAERDAANEEMKDEKAKVEERLGIKFSDHGFNEETGLFRRIPD